MLLLQDIKRIFQIITMEISFTEIDFDEKFDLDSTPCSRRYNSDFKILAKDTIDADVGISAGDAQIDGDLAVRGGVER